MIEVKPLTEQECQAANLVPKGVYAFQVQMTKEKSSPKVGAFFSLRHKVFMPNNRQRTVFDALFFTDQMMWKTRHFYTSVDRMDIYESGKFMAQDCDLLEGYCEIDHRVNKETGEIEHYVKDYVMNPDLDAQHGEEIAEDFKDDDIPNLS